MGPQADVVHVGVGAAVLDNQIRDSVYRQGTRLADVVRVIQLPASDLIESQRLIDELQRGNQHSI